MGARKLALSDEILLSVEKPARYIGNEINMVKKDPAQVDVRFCMRFPDVYDIVCHILAYRSFTICSISGRTSGASVCIPRGWIWISPCVSREQIPLFALESAGAGNRTC